MSARLIHHFAIAARRGGLLDLVAPDDFQLVLRAVSDTPHLPPNALAYCADPERERVLFTCHAPADIPALFAGPFLFVEQLRLAGSVISVPAERLGELGLTRVAPVLIFSAGRAGSTLLARLLSAAGLGCASEPDMLTQMVSLADETRRKLPAGMDIAMAGACIGALGRVLGEGAFLKLRSQCNANPILLLGAAASGRTIFLLRKARSWAASRQRVFGENPRHIAAILRQTMDALDTVLSTGVPCDIVWFETLARDPLAALRICAPGVRPNAARIAATMAADSQGGTILARDAVAGARIAPGFVGEFEAFWAGACATATWSAATHALIDEMWKDSADP